jgi:aspartokinase-like uncharacterized kinase
MHLRVVKLGGSQLKIPGLGDRLRSWIRSEPPAATLLLVGGGAPVDAIRELAQANSYDEAFLHWLCVDLMEFSFRMLAAQLPEWPRVQTHDELMRMVEDINHEDVRASREPAALPRVGQPKSIQALVNIAAYYNREVESALPIRLPLSWDTTSDSLAALLAHLIHADELVLLKSCAVDVASNEAESGWERLASLGVVDGFFPDVSRGLKRIRCVAMSSPDAAAPGS